MCAEELTNQVLFMRNVPVGDQQMWMAFEAVEDGQLGEALTCVKHLSCSSHCLSACLRAAAAPQGEGPGAGAAVVPDGRPQVLLPGGEEHPERTRHQHPHLYVCEGGNVCVCV